MSRPIWSGHVSFGLVTIPVNLHSAEQRTDLQLHLLDSRDQSRVRYERVNEDTGEEVPWSEVVRGYEFSDGNYVVLSEEDLKRAAPEVTKVVEIDGFVKAAEIDFIYFDKPYYLEPGKGGDKGYVLLRRALEESRMVGLAKVVIRTRQYIAALIPRGEALVLDLLRYPQEVRSAEGLRIPAASSRLARVAPAEMKMALTLIDTMKTTWKPQQYHDEYREALLEWIQKTAKTGRKPARKPERKEDAPASYNFTELLKQSLAKSRGSAGARTSKKRRKAS